MTALLRAIRPVERALTGYAAGKPRKPQRTNGSHRDSGQCLTGAQTFVDLHPRAMSAGKAATPVPHAGFPVTLPPTPWRTEPGAQ
ncbi:hypothetical protein I553_0435 [Mycobacterium xenopi 4042]|uniref:Uncharacterized protein n=1 Tax=Mycobacterium xenopi 4042 TaxID=1299334 RepID=X7YLW3_MYCXE|nr:hypothetical protein I553_0435 [Mycobacterium xenopi 4042]